MKIQEFLAKADEVKEINVVDHFDNGMMTKNVANSSVKNKQECVKWIASLD